MFTTEKTFSCFDCITITGGKTREGAAASPQTGSDWWLFFSPTLNLHPVTGPPEGHLGGGGPLKTGQCDGAAVPTASRTVVGPVAEVVTCRVRDAPRVVEATQRRAPTPHRLTEKNKNAYRH